MYEYEASVLRVVDGDTVHVEIDLGLDTYRRVTLRLLSINAPELREPGGKESREYLRGLIEGKAVVVKTVKDRREKYGRYLATLFVDGKSINDEMVTSGHAK